MSKPWLFVAAALIAIVLISTFAGNRIGAGAGALILIGTIIYVTVRQKSEGGAGVARAERGAKDLREELDAEDNP